MKRSSLLLLAAAFTLGGCQTADPYAAQRAATREAIRQEVAGNYFVGRRLYKRNYKMWGWVREPGRPWSTARLVMLNEQRKLAPDRSRGELGSDHNFEYRLSGFFSGDMVYEPASDRFYPEFVLTDYELLNSSPPMIYRNARVLDPSARVIETPL